MKTSPKFKLALCAILTSIGVLSPVHAETEGIALVPKVATTPTIDGEIDAIYHASNANLINTVQSGTVESAVDCSATWYGVYDADKLYFIVDINDQFLNATSGGANWQQDIIEVYFNMDNAKPGGGNGHSADNYQYHFGWNAANDGGVSSNGSFANVEWVQVTTSKGWRIEASIPWATLKVTTPTVGQKIGFDIAVNDNDGQVAYDSVMYWYNSAGALYGNIDGAGEIEIGGDFDGNYRPVISQLTEVQMGTEGIASSIGLTAADANASDTLTFSASGLPAFASLVDNGNGAASINVNATAGDANIYYFDATVSDGVYSDTTNVILIVKDPNVASQVPVFDAVGTVNVAEGSLENVDIVVTDLDSLSAVISATSLPDFVTLTDNGDKTATLVVNPSFGDAGSYSAELLVTDEANNTNTLVVSIVVTAGVVRTEFYCDPVNGSMSNDGSMESPWASLEAVFTAGKLFKVGDTIYLLSGYHGEPTISAANSDYVYIKAATGATPTMSKVSLAGSATYWDLSGVTVSRSFAPTYSIDTMVSISGQYNVVDDFEIYSVDDISSWGISEWLAYAATGAAISGTHCVLSNSTVRNIKWGVFVNGDYSRMSGCTIQNFSGDGARALGDYTVIEDTLITDNYNVDSNHDDGIQSFTDGSGGIGSGVVTGVILRRNTIIQTTDVTRPLQGYLQGIGLFDGFYDDWVVENNVVIVDAFHAIALYGARNCKIVNNTVVNLTAGTRAWIRIDPHKTLGASTGNLIANNLTSEVYSASASYATLRNNSDINESDYGTYFVDYPNDLRLKAGSPAIDAGFNADAPVLDRTGVTRLSETNTIVDTGAYEAIVTTWYGWPLSDGVFVDTGSYLGWLSVGRDPWIYNYTVEGWIYFPTFTQPDGAGAWGYIKR